MTPEYPFTIGTILVESVEKDRILCVYHFHLQADKDDPVSMGDPKKELSEEDFDKFDAKRSEAMGVFSEGTLFPSKAY